MVLLPVLRLHFNVRVLLQDVDDDDVTPFLAVPRGCHIFMTIPVYMYSIDYVCGMYVHMPVGTYVCMYSTELD
jgi:hypothetical protein